MVLICHISSLLAKQGTNLEAISDYKSELCPAFKAADIFLFNSFHFRISALISHCSKCVLWSLCLSVNINWLHLNHGKWKCFQLLAKCPSLHALISMAQLVLITEGRCCGNVLFLADHEKDRGVIMDHTSASSQQLHQANNDLLNEKENVTKSFSVLITKS